MFAAPIAFQAARNPHAVAMVLPNTELTYQKLDSDINAVAHKLAGILPPGGGLCLLMAGDLYLHFVLALALGRLNVPSTSVDPGRQDVLIPMLGPRVILSDRDVSAPHAALEIRVSSDWMREAVASGVRSPPAVRARPSDPGRIVTSSGTTGRPKKVLLSHEMIIRRFKSGAISVGPRQDLRMLTLIGLDTAWGFGAALRTWWLGGAVCILKPDPETLVSRRVTTLAASPRQLQGVLARLAPDSAALADLAVIVGGSKVPLALSVTTRLRLSSALTFAYGSAEAGSVALCPAGLQDGDANAAGHLVPWVEVEAVDENGKVLPPGETGELRIRSDEVVGGYLDDEEASRKAFRDGWFHPGDIGSVTQKGLLKVVGRSDDVINVGGVKISPEQIENVLTGCAGVSDAALFAKVDERGVERLWAAVVEDGTFDSKAAMEKLTQELRASRIDVRITTVAGIPRNPMGKVERYKLRDLAPTARVAASVPAPTA